MKRLLTTVALCLGFANSANAQTITIIPDKAEYNVSDLIFLTVVADAQGLGGQSDVFGFLRYSPSLGVAVGVQTIQQFLAGNPLGPVTSLGGTIEWQPGNTSCGVFGCTGFNHTQGVTTHPPDGPIISTLVLFANLNTSAFPGGCIALDWARTGGFALDFFGVTPANSPGVCLTINGPDLDIKPLEPGDPIDPEGKNPINLKSNSISAAIITNDHFDALQVVPSSVLLAPAGAPTGSGSPEIHPNGMHVEDVNGDGRLDLMGHFDTELTGIEFGDFVACISGANVTGGGVLICDNIAVRQPKP
jgi:hypothetical protein